MLIFQTEFVRGLNIVLIFQTEFVRGLNIVLIFQTEFVRGPNIVLMDRFKSNQTLHFCHFLDFLYFFEGNSRLVCHSAMKIQGLENECEPQVRVRSN